MLAFSVQATLDVAPTGNSGRKAVCHGTPGPILTHFATLDNHVARLRKSREHSDDALSKVFDVAEDILNRAEHDRRYSYGPVSAARLLYAVRTATIAVSPSRPTPSPYLERRLDVFLDGWHQRLARIGGLRTFRARALANVLFAFAGIDRVPPRRFLVSWEHVAATRLHTFNPQELSLIIQSYSLLRIPPATATFATRLPASLLARLPVFNDAALVTAFHAALKIPRLSLPHVLVNAWVERVLARIDNLTPLGLTNSLHALAKLATRSPALELQPALRKRFLEAWTRAAGPKLSMFSDQALTVTVYSLGHVGDGEDVTGSFVRLWLDAVKERLRPVALSCQGLSNCIYALGRLGVRPDDEFLELWDRASRWKADEFTSQHFCNIIVGFSGLGIQPTRRFMLVWFAYSEPRDFTPQGLANAVSALAKLDLSEVPDEFASDWRSAAENALPQFSSQELCSTLFALARLQWPTSRSLLARWCTRASELMQEFTARELSVTIHAFGRMGLVPESDFLTTWRSAVLCRETEFSADQATTVLVALAKLALFSVVESTALKRALTNAVASGWSALSAQDATRTRATLVALQIELPIAE